MSLWHPILSCSRQGRAVSVAGQVPPPHRFGQLGIVIDVLSPEPDGARALCPDAPGAGPGPDRGEGGHVGVAVEDRVAVEARREDGPAADDGSGT